MTTQEKAEELVNKALIALMREVLSVIAYQPGIPLEHKKDIAVALVNFEKATDALNAARKVDNNAKRL